MSESPPRRSPPHNKGRRIVKINRLSQALLMKALMDGDKTLHELADETGLHYMTVCGYTSELYRHGVLHIAAWGLNKANAPLLKIYKLGHGKDARRVRMSYSERSRRYRNKVAGRKLHEAMSFINGGEK